MRVETIRRVLVTQREELDHLFDNETIVERRTPDLMRYLSHPNILAILGVRRCGKSVLASMLLRGKVHGYVNFDDERLGGMKASDLDMVLEAMYGMYGSELDYLVMDEIQNVPGWELFANRLRRTKKVIITGSNATLLSGDLATHLTGRHLDFTLFPFSFGEFLGCRGMDIKQDGIYSTAEISKIKKQLEAFVELGGFPEVQKFGKQVLPRIYDDILIKDAVLRYGIRYRTTFRELARYLMGNAAREFTYSRLGRFLSLKDVHTVKNYVDFLRSVHLLFVLERYSRKFKQRIIAPKKAYVIDTGLARAVAPAEPEGGGRTMENIVAIELFRRAAFSEAPQELFYWKDHQQREVDFVLVEKGKVEKLIQSCLRLQDESTADRELGNLVRASKELGCKDLSVITWEEEQELVHDGKRIRVIPLWKWLLTG
jgi:predicted AAA+ superfamily ATPase